ncbi:MAG TPA: energy-coupling factor transporter ATPase [Syntrophomonas sp.]|jgi:energy-coupling factor transport system ATP-binding protein|nr:energy-coupling factor transporter ATPase [Syntrophomonas sp.]
MIRLSDVTYTYPQSKEPAVKKISLTIRKKEFIAIMGRNGSGKSTLARLINGLLMPDLGEVTVDGLSSLKPENLVEIRKRVGLLFPDPDSQLLSNLVEEEIAFGPENLGLNPIEIGKRVDTALKMVSMEDYAKYPPYLLSGGQKQKLCIASLLAMQPAYLVLDEPFSMLEPRGRKDLLSLLLTIRRDFNITLILITHNLEDAIQADQIIMMNQGEVINMAHPREILKMGTQLTMLGIEPLELTTFIELLKHNAGMSIAHDTTDIESLVEAICHLS